MREIYAELSKRMLPLVEDGTIAMPSFSDITYSRRNGSRACFFTCDDNLLDKDQKELIKEVAAYLDNLGISWQEN